MADLHLLFWENDLFISSPFRDDYDREVKQAKEKQKKRHTPLPSRPKKPDLQVYHPRHRGGGDLAPGMEYEESNESSSSADPEPPGSELFCLEYEADSGEITSVIVHKEDDPDEVTEKICSKNQLEPAMRKVLKQRIQEEMVKRQVQH
ncbi:UPF0561 protein C2orf68 homolog isoform X2 [Rhinatrema bivittatum]|uniref:UPF0561 protein C2orf68 homolog isoform X2 n=1 Tax=Rhinatrema bivittatum TaxID=194408 RepID=UPI00112C4C00|nr:UPF0561 protein C2orf68 homolog isoform X2 [Rhinatrema bivittatum]